MEANKPFTEKDSLALITQMTGLSKPTMQATLIQVQTIYKTTLF